MVSKKEKIVKLLIIDDEKDICDFIKSLFERRGFEVYTAARDSVALKIAKAKRPDIALIDIHMKKGSGGIEILKSLREIHPDCKCIMATWDKEKALEAVEMGAVGYVIKPNEIKDLISAVNKAVKTLNRSI